MEIWLVTLHSQGRNFMLSILLCFFNSIKFGPDHLVNKENDSVHFLAGKIVHWENFLYPATTFHKLLQKGIFHLRKLETILFLNELLQTTCQTKMQKIVNMA